MAWPIPPALLDPSEPAAILRWVPLGLLGPEAGRATGAGVEDVGGMDATGLRGCTVQLPFDTWSPFAHAGYAAHDNGSRFCCCTGT